MTGEGQVDWNDLKLFRIVAEELSFTRAAARARVSQPWLSQRIRRLERRTGTRLLDRTSHHVALTPDGDRLLAAVQEMTLTWLEAWRSVGDVRTRPAGVAGPVAAALPGPDAGPAVVRVGLLEINPTRLVRHLRELPGAPSVRVHPVGDAAAGVGALREGAVDVVIGYFFDADAAPSPPSDVVVSCVVRERLHVAMAADHALAVRDSVALGDLADQPWVMRLEPDVRAQQVRLLRRAGFEPRIAHLTSTMDTLRVLIGTGQAVDLASPLFRTPAEVTLRPLSDPVDSLFLLLCRRDLDADLAEGVVTAVRRWYVAGLEEFGSPWLARVIAPTASPTLRAAAATARRSRPATPTAAGADPARA